MGSTSQVAFRLPEALAARLRSVASDRGLTASDVVRVALAAELGLPRTAAEMPPHPGGPGRGHKGTRES